MSMSVDLSDRALRACGQPSVGSAGKQDASFEVCPSHREVVESDDWFASLSLELRNAILSRTRVRHVRRGTVLLRSGRMAVDWIGVVSGSLSMEAAFCGSRSITLDLLGAGAWYGDVELLDRRPSKLDIIARENCTVLLVTQRDVLNVIEESREFKDALLAQNCRRLRHMVRRLVELQTLPMSQRVALLLQRLARQFGEQDCNGLRIGVQLSQSDLARQLCIGRQRVNLLMSKMRSLGIVECTHNFIVVRDLNRLSSIAEGRDTVDLEKPAICKSHRRPS